MIVRAPIPLYRYRGMGAYTALQQQIVDAANANGVDPSLALAVAQKESSFNPSAVSPKNSNGTVDYGLFQLNSSNLASFGVTDPLDPTQNINAGVSYLAQLLRQFGGDAAQALTAYNAGPAAAASGNISPYASSVISLQNNFAEVAAPGMPSPPNPIASSGDTSSLDTLSASVLGGGDMTPVYVGLGLLGGILAWRLFGR